MLTDDKLAPVIKRLLGGLVSVGLSFCLVGCGDGDFSDLNKHIAEVKARPKSAIEPLPEIKVVEPFLFNGDDLRDPFTAVAENNPDDMAEKLGGSGVKPDPLHQKEDLEQYPLDALRMVGTMRIGPALWGLIKVNVTDVAGKDGGLGTIHRVKVGNYMGTNYGKILRIAEDKIELMEIVPDKPGTWREQEQELPLVLAE
ncbi:MAG: pilus assembly protein PilP [Methylococcales bacterium]